ncbi:MAG: insulinase family protein [Dehalococcoidia bacterium]|nr:insulinase family protein [Dehalococcoidia bacterium]
MPNIPRRGAAVTTDATPTSDILPFRATERTLANGLRVIVVPTGFPNLVSLQIPVKTGSRNEVEPGKSGFAHFFEHMMFRGTERFPAHAYQEVITQSGARQNAYTTDDYTNYHITFAKEDLERILDLEADRFMGLKYSHEDFKTESRAILGEYNKSASDPLTKLIEVQRDHAYSTHTYKHTTMGFLADIEDMPNQFDYSLAFFDRWYRPEFTTIIVAGDVEPEATVALVEKYWGSWQPGTVPPPVVPQEPPAAGPAVAHVPWPAPTLPWVSVAFHGPAFSDGEPAYAALDILMDLFFGETSDLYQRLVEQEQVVDQLFPYLPSSEDPGLATVFARVKDPAKAPYVRDAIIATVREARQRPVTAERLAEAKSNARYGFARTLDNSESIASTLARFVRFTREYDTLNRLFRVYERLTPGDLHAAALTYLGDANLVFATLAQGELPAGIAELPAIGERETARAGASLPSVVLRSPSPLLRFKLLFGVGSAHDPAGKEGLAQLAAEMIASGGSTKMRIDEINRALFPIAGSFDAQVDKEMTVFTGVTHRDNLDRFLGIALPQLLTPGFREDDFARIKEKQANELVQDLRANNEEELGKERLQENIFRGTRYAHPALGTMSGIAAITLDDVKVFVAGQFTRANLTVGLAGDLPEGFEARLADELAVLPEGTKTPPPTVEGRMPSGMEVEIVTKETRSTAISFGHPIPVTRSHPDFAALWLARAWLGEHRASQGRLFQRLREVRGLNYGNYAYIEAFPRGMYQFFPDANLGRRAQLFEVWIRPVVPENAVFALKLAIHELARLIEEGLSAEEFETTRNYLAKNVFVTTKTQDQQLGYALDSRWYGTGEYVEHMRAELAGLTRERVNEALRRYLSAENLSVVMITKDGEALREQLLSPAPATIAYDAPKAPEVLAEDAVAGARQLGLRGEAIRVTPVEDVFA